MKFINENTEIATKGYFRTGIYNTKINNYKIQVIRNYITNDCILLNCAFTKYIKGNSYDLCISKGNGWDWLYNVNLDKCNKVIKNIQNGTNYGLSNSF